MAKKVHEIRVWQGPDEKVSNQRKRRLAKIVKYWNTIPDGPTSTSAVVNELIDEEYQRLRTSGAIK
jgi:hypothetical protein